RKMQGVDEQTLAVWADRNDPLARVDYDLSDCGLAGVAQRIPDYAVPVFGETAVREEVIGAVNVNRVQVVGIDKLGNIDRIGRLEPQLLQVVRLDRYVAALLVFVPLDDLAAVDWTEPRTHIR